MGAGANDTLVLEVYPSEAHNLAVHMLHWATWALPRGRKWDLEALSDDCAADGVYEFFLAATPEPFSQVRSEPRGPGGHQVAARVLLRGAPGGPLLVFWSPPFDQEMLPGGARVSCWPRGARPTIAVLGSANLGIVVRSPPHPVTGETVFGR
ncbi:MAG: hypothetical protein Ct9H300mP31_19050 [Acidimicrobiaceae bacterium]|nr:MAG: hypothetical protein Ct9H300mP31_19050 [Acidimicrobiaceae bacterium]